MYNYTRLTGSARQSYAGVLPTIRQHLRLPDEDTSEDDLIQLYFAAACNDAEQITERAIVGGLFEATMDIYPTDEIFLPTPPLALFSPLASYIRGGNDLVPAVEFVKMQNVFGLGESTLDASEYRVVFGGTGPSRIVSTDWQQGFPIAASKRSAVCVQYWAGYAIEGVGNTEAVSFMEMPAAMLGAILDLTAARYSLRSSQIIGTSSSDPSSISARDTLERFRVNPHVYERM